MGLYYNKEAISIWASVNMEGSIICFISVVLSGYDRIEHQASQLRKREQTIVSNRLSENNLYVFRN